MKALIVIDMPKNCSLCPISNNWLENGESKWFCPLNGKECDFIERPVWCPLKPMPSKASHNTDSNFIDGFIKGYNTCLYIIEINYGKK